MLEAIRTNRWMCREQVRNRASARGTSCMITVRKYSNEILCLPSAQAKAGSAQVYVDITPFQQRSIVVFAVAQERERGERSDRAARKHPPVAAPA